MLYFLLLVPVILYIWIKFIDCDLTLLWCHCIGQNKLKKYDGRVVWITGASSGIGEAIAYKYASLGARLVLSGTRLDALNKVESACIEKGAKGVLCLPFDISDNECHQGKLDEVLEKFSRVDVLVNNAGRLQRAEFIATNVDAEKALFDVNVFGVISLCRVVVKYWISSNQTKAELFVTSSAAGKMGSPFSSSYAGSKHALHGYLETLRDELSCMDFPISITIGCPGPVISNLRTNAMTETLGKTYGRDDNSSQRKLMKTSRCADLIVSGIAHNLDELWMADHPLLALYYIYQYFPSTFRLYLIKRIMTKKQVEKFRKGE